MYEAPKLIVKSSYNNEASFLHSEWDTKLLLPSLLLSVVIRTVTGKRVSLRERPSRTDVMKSHNGEIIQTETPWHAGITDNYVVVIGKCFQHDLPNTRLQSPSARRAIRTWLWSLLIHLDFTTKNTHTHTQRGWGVLCFLSLSVATYKFVIWWNRKH